MALPGSTPTTRLGSAIEGVWKKMARTAVKSVRLTPSPRPSDSMLTTNRPGLPMSTRAARRAPCSSDSIIPVPDATSPREVRWPEPLRGTNAAADTPRSHQIAQLPAARFRRRDRYRSDSAGLTRAVTGFLLSFRTSDSLAPRRTNKPVETRDCRQPNSWNMLCLSSTFAPC